MKTRRASAKVDRVHSIVEMARGVAKSADRKNYSLGLECALTELVREEMRQMVQHESPRGSAVNLLQNAIGRIEAELSSSFRQHNVSCDLRKYLKKVREELVYTAKEIQTLGGRLAESRGVERLGGKEEVFSDTRRRYIVHELGLREAIQGLLVEPADEVREIDIDAIRELSGWQVMGEWFPYEVTVDEFVFVIDDDGSIFVSTANLPTGLQEDARGTLRHIADILFGHG